MWDPPEGCNPTQALDLLQKKVELLGGKDLGTWTIDCETLQSTQALSKEEERERDGGVNVLTKSHSAFKRPLSPFLPAAGGPQKLIHMLHSSEYPRTTFAVLDSMNCIVADNTLDSIFMNLRQFYAPSTRKGLKIEVKGYHFEVKKYVIKFGSIVIGSTNRAIVVEVRLSK